MISGERARVPVEAAEQVHRLVDRDLLGELGLLQRDPDPLLQLERVGLPAEAKDLDVARVGRVEALADLDRGGLAGAVGTEKAEAFTGPDLEVEAVHGANGVVVLAKPAIRMAVCIGE